MGFRSGLYAGHSISLIFSLRKISTPQYTYVYYHCLTVIKWIAFSFDPGDDFSCENHELSSPGNSVSCPITENPIFLGQTFQLLERKLNLST